MSDAGGAPSVPRDVDRSSLDPRVSALVERLVAATPGSDAADRALREVRTLGDRTVRTASERIARRPAAAAQAPRALADLRATLEPLDPAAARVGRRFLGLIPLGPTPHAFFARYPATEPRLAAALAGIRAARDDLRRETAALGVEGQRLDADARDLARLAGTAATLAEHLDAAARTLAASDPERARLLRTDGADVARARQADLLTAQATTTQARLAIDVLTSTRGTLDESLGRAESAATAALGTAVAVARALTHQQRALDRIDRLVDDAGAALADEAPGSLDALAAAFARFRASADAATEPPPT